MQKIILYGAGRVGHTLIELAEKYGIKEVIDSFCDENHIGEKIKDIPITSYSDAKKKKLPFLISTGARVREEIQNILDYDHQNYFKEIDDWLATLDVDLIAFHRDFVSQYHIRNMEGYFKNAETKESINVFWGGDTIFYKLFSKLDLTNIIELACGRGRHLPQYIEKAKNVTVVDVLQKNIDYCRRRFADYSQVHFYCNNGCDLADLANNSYTSLFTYDAMVHFEMFDIYNYLKETERVLISGGRALFHHSNWHNSYKENFTTNPIGRNYMSQELFCYLAYRAGLEIVESQVIDWPPFAQSDCLTLVEKR